LTGTGGADAALLVFGVFLGSTTWWVILTAVVAVLSSRVTIRALTWVNRVSGAAILVFAVLAIVGALYRWPPT
jgi:threonine/homoserine/homoserine lactone efflux protein